ncbi:MAG: hypothetical protein Q4F80_08855, partial [bacterium]|nr:hypothetical protein [bacterium]
MRFEFDDDSIPPIKLKLHESDNYAILPGYLHYSDSQSNGCGAFGLNNNPDNTTKPPCFIVVDVNGDRKPYPANVNCASNACAEQNYIKPADTNSNVVSDVFTILITDKEAIPFGVVAQKAMYQARK